MSVPIASPVGRVNRERWKYSLRNSLRFRKGEIFVANRDSDNVPVISDSTNTIVANVTVGNAPFGVAYDPSKSEVFVVDSADSNVSVISDASNKVVATVIGVGFQDAVYDPAKGEVYVANSGDGKVSVISDAVSSVSTTAVTSTTGPGTTTASTSTSSSTSGGGGVPVFPYQFAAATVFTLLLVVSYLLVRRPTPSGNRASKEGSVSA